MLIVSYLSFIPSHLLFSRISYSLSSYIPAISYSLSSHSVQVLETEDERRRKQIKLFESRGVPLASFFEVEVPATCHSLGLVIQGEKLTFVTGTRRKTIDCCSVENSALLKEVNTSYQTLT